MKKIKLHNEFVNHLKAQIQNLSFKSLLGLGAKATVKLGEDKLLQLSDALDYIGSEQADAVASHLNMAIELIQEREPKEAQPHIKKFQKACKEALKELDESVVTEGSKSRMIKQIERAIKDGDPIYTLPMDTQDYYRKNYRDFKPVNEGKTSAVYTDPKTGKGYDLQYVSSKKRWELDIMKKGASIYSNAITTIKRNTLAEIQEWLDGYKIDSSWTKGLSESDNANKMELLDQVKEASDMNDPVLVAFRAAKMKREKELAKPKRKPLYGKQRLKAEDDLWYISQDLKDLYADRGQLLNDMEQEAEAEGGPIADEYGDKLNKIEDEIQKLISNRNKLEVRLAESVVNESVDEAKLSKIHNATKKGSYPVTLVVTENGKVIKQELVGTPQIVPAAFNQLKKEYPKATVHVESKTGERLFSESVNEAKNSFPFKGRVEDLESQIGNKYYIETTDDEDTYNVMDSKTKKFVGNFHYDGKTVTLLDMPNGIMESVVNEGLNKSDVAYQLAVDYTGNTKPKITKLNKKRIHIKYGYKISPEKVIDSIKKVHPEVELKHVEWSDKMSGGGFHIFDILESVNEKTISIDWEDDENAFVFSDAGMIKVDYDGGFKYRSKWFDTAEHTGPEDLIKDLNKAFKADKFVYVNEAKESVTEAKGWNAVAKVMDAALKKANVSLSYAKEYAKSLEGMAKRDAKEFFADYGDFTEDDFIEDVEYNMRNESVTEAKFNKKKLMKAMKKDDGVILVGGKEYIVYKYDNGNDDNDEMWQDDAIFALDQDGEEHEIKYSDIERYSESVVTESFASFTNSLNEKWNFSEAEVKAAAEQLAKAMANTDKVKVEVHDLEYDKGRGAGFELSWDGDKHDGGSYYIKDNGDVINAAIGGVKFGTITSTQRDFEKGIRATSKARNESRVTEATEVRYKKGDKIEYQLTHKGGVGKYADAMSKSKNTESGVIKKRIKGFGGTYKYLLTSGLELYASEIIGLWVRRDESAITERKIQTKRKYTENHPAKTVGKDARIRNKILEVLKDGKMNQASFDKLVKELSSDNKRWMKRNSKMFNVSEDGISLSRFGQKILKGIVVNESFKSFTDSLNESLSKYV